MKLGIVADEISRDFAAAVAIGKSLGLLRYEIRNLTTGRAPLSDPAEIAQVEAIAEREEIAITALSPGLFKLTSDEAAFDREMSDIYPRAAALAHRWQLPGLIVFGFHKAGATEGTAPEFPSHDPPAQVLDWLARAAERAHADGLLLMIEPEPICWADSGRATAALIQQTGASSLRINYDPGNVAWLENRDPIGEFDAVAPYIANVHIKDLRPLTRGAAHPEWVPAGQGMIDYVGHFSALRRIRYTGPISLEPHMDSTRESTSSCKSAVESLWGAEPHNGDSL